MLDILTKFSFDLSFILFILFVILHSILPISRLSVFQAHILDYNFLFFFLYNFHLKRFLATILKSFYLITKIHGQSFTICRLYNHRDYLSFLIRYNYWKFIMINYCKFRKIIDKKKNFLCRCNQKKKKKVKWSWW